MSIDPRVRIDVNLQTILYYIKSKLITDGIYNTTTCFIGENPTKNLVPPSTIYAEITGEQQMLVNAECQTWAGQVTVRCIQYVNLDIAMRDNINMTQGTGIIRKINQVIQSLNMWDMNNGAYYFLAEPMRYNHQIKVEREVDQSSKSLQWSYCDIFFDILYGENPNYVAPAIAGGDEFTSEFSGGFV